MQQQTLSDYQTYGCPHCDRSFQNQPALNSHKGLSHDTRIQIDCAFCGDTVEKTPSKVKRANNIFCSGKCRGKWMSENMSGEDSPHYESITVTCDWCGVEFDTKPCWVKKSEHNYCSRSCFGNWRSEYYGGGENPCYNRIEEDCYMCGETVKRRPSSINRGRTFCSQECKHQWIGEFMSGESSPHWTGDRTTIECDWCDSEFDVVPTQADSRRFCSKGCADDFFNSTEWSGHNNPRWKGGYNIYAAVKKLIGDCGWQKTARNAREENGDYCHLCGSPADEFERALDVNHIVPITSGGDNGSWNLMPLCRQCHPKADAYVRSIPEIEPVLTP